MKRLFLVVSCAVVLGGCATKYPTPVPLPPAHARATEPVLLDANGTPMERIPFRAGVSTVTVENMAREAGCIGGQGAGLVTPQGPVEMYRMMCDNKQVFMARCEFRQCKAMAAPRLAQSYVPAVVVATPVSAPYAKPVAAPAAAPAAAPVAAPVVVDNAVPSASKGVLASRALPMLKLRWACGECAVNDKIAAMINLEYEKVAAHKRYTISDVETTDVAIVSYEQSNSANHDKLVTKITFRGITLDGVSDTKSSPGSVNKLAQDTAEHIYRIMSRAVVRKDAPAAAAAN